MPAATVPAFVLGKAGRTSVFSRIASIIPQIKVNNDKQAVNCIRGFEEKYIKIDVYGNINVKKSMCMKMTKNVKLIQF